MPEEDAVMPGLRSQQIRRSGDEFVPPDGLCWISVLSCLLLACSYVGSLYVWKSDLPRYGLLYADSRILLWFCLNLGRQDMCVYLLSVLSVRALVMFRDFCAEVLIVFCRLDIIGHS